MNLSRSRSRFGLTLITIGMVLVVLTTQSDAQVPPRLDVSVADIGQRFTVTLAGPPGAPFALLVDTQVERHRRTSGGRLCMDLGAGFHAVRDGISSPGPRLPASGRIEIQRVIPDDAMLLGKVLSLQAVVRDYSRPRGFLLSNCAVRGIGNGSIGNFRQRWLDLPWPQTLILYDFDVADFDGDSKLDIVAATIRNHDPLHPLWPGGELLLFLNDGRGGFTDATDNETAGIPRPTDHTYGGVLAHGDVDGDGDLDLMMAGSAGLPGTGQPRLYLNDGRALFTDATFTETTQMPRRDTGLGARIYLVDIDGDGDNDVIEGGCGELARQPVRAWINVNGLGSFVDTYGTADARFPNYHECAARLALFDIDADGAVDVFATIANSQPYIFLNDGAGYFRLPTPSDPVGLPALADKLTVTDIVVFDADSDHDQDIFLSSGNLFQAENHLLINSNGLGLFVEGSRGPITGIPSEREWSAGAAAGDIDRDGDIDLFVDRTVTHDQLLLNKGLGYFTDEASSPGAGVPYFFQGSRVVALADVDGDGDLDLVTAYGPSLPEAPPERGIRVLYNE